LRWFFEAKLPDLPVTSEQMNRRPVQRSVRAFPARLVLLLLLAFPETGALSQVGLNLIQQIPLPGVSGRIDHLSADPGGNRLFVAALGNNTVEVIDLDRGAVVHTISGLGEPQGVLCIAESGRVWISNGEDGSCRIFDSSSFAKFRSVSLGDDADNIRYDAARRQVCVGYGNGAIAVLDAASGDVRARIPLDAHPESFQLGPDRIYVNVPGARQLAVVDRHTNRVVANAAPSARSNFPMALDPGGHRLYVGCRNPSRLLVFTTDPLKEIASVRISGDVDDIFIDDGRLIYCSCGEGFLDIVRESGRDEYSRIGRIPTAPGARTSLMVSDRNRFYVAVPRRGNRQAEILVFSMHAEGH
jgi:YVTN family beta-propeller protein